MVALTVPPYWHMIGILKYLDSKFFKDFQSWNSFTIKITMQTLLYSYLIISYQFLEMSLIDRRTVYFHCLSERKSPCCRHLYVIAYYIYPLPNWLLFSFNTCSNINRSIYSLIHICNFSMTNFLLAYVFRKISILLKNWHSYFKNYSMISFLNLDF